MRIFISFYVELIWLPRYMKLSTSFRLNIRQRINQALLVEIYFLGFNKGIGTSPT